MCFSDFTRPIVFTQVNHSFSDTGTYGPADCNQAPTAETSSPVMRGLEYDGGLSRLGALVASTYLFSISRAR